jgi:arylformamidase
MTSSDHDQAEIDAAFDTSPAPAHAPNKLQVISRMEKRSELMRARIGEPHIVRYGSSPIETVSYYPTKATNAPIHVHVHGGGWRQRKGETVLFPAEAFVNAGIAFAVLDFTAADEQHGDIRPMLQQVCEGLAWVSTHAHELGGDAERLYVSGFSSGAHLAGAALAADWTQFGIERAPCRGAVLFSGVYDLRAVRRAKPFSYLAVTDEIEQSLSPRRHPERFDVPTILAYGKCEPAEFQRQSSDFVLALREAGKSVELLAIDGCNHYEMMESFGNPYSVLGHASIAQALGK